MYTITCSLNAGEVFPNLSQMIFRFEVSYLVPDELLKPHTETLVYNWLNDYMDHLDQKTIFHLTYNCIEDFDIYE